MASVDHETATSEALASQSEGGEVLRQGAAQTAPAAAASAEASDPPSPPVAAGGAAPGEGTRPVEQPVHVGSPPKRRPCFHCGAMTPVKTLDETGELCWRCYRPAGARLVRTLLTLAVLLVLAAGAIIGGQWYVKQQQQEDSLDKPVSEENAAPVEITQETKLTILRRYFLDNEPAAKLCSQYGVAPDEFRRWVEAFFAAGQKASQPTAIAEFNPLEHRITDMERKLLQLGKLVGDLKDNLVELRREVDRHENTVPQQYILDPSGPPPPVGPPAK